ncbi:TonB-dependent outer membrane receptor [Hyphomicrobium sp. xq]|uniref:TonB-dependent outer membrane receptor n=1 Tax=Hyphomicrobium album TaxID=2665159 RepID=A0A6I3KEG1_9HYPH|nr:STN domain-containing protein [Hyphomicrobium album]MTD92719.1 TonB-dependent outer membrane receptor [Hyphomicrobium album]
MLSFQLGYVAAAVLAASAATAASNAQSLDSAAAPAISFDIPSQPLANALYAYSTATGIEILVPGDMLEHRRAGAVRGVLPAEEALHVLLSGTGLSPRNTGVRAFTLVPVVAPSAAPATRVPRFPKYSAALQAAVTRALCRLERTRPGRYRIAARLWVAPTGRVTQVSLLGSTTDGKRDAALVRLLSTVVVGESPPSDMPQPTTMMVLPNRSDAAGCGAGGPPP